MKKLVIGLVLGVLAVLVLFMLTTGVWARPVPRNNPRQPFEQMESKPDAIESKLVALGGTLALVAECAGRRFVGRGLTVFDCQTRLEWEIKTEDNVNDTFTWSNCIRPLCPPNGTAFEYIVMLNTEPCFAGHCDWRLPEVAELETILVAPFYCGPLSCKNPIYGPTPYILWSATTETWAPRKAWTVEFFLLGSTNPYWKGEELFISVRAVRTGP